MSDNQFGLTKRGKVKRVKGLVFPVPTNVFFGGGTRYALQDVKLVLDELGACKNGRERLIYVQSRRKIVVKEMTYYAKCKKQLAECEAFLESCRYEE
ncbi:hypothetical protein AAF712_012251 [Marasmius tenuissimus]|uniref:Uncharacterized protein n=1 Tax=Marasmius tenuissimus TaxID=585030 RepID=A0ABR2ZHY6_9AGAR